MKTKQTQELLVLSLASLLGSVQYIIVCKQLHVWQINIDMLLQQEIVSNNLIIFQSQILLTDFATHRCTPPSYILYTEQFAFFMLWSFCDLYLYFVLCVNLMGNTKTG